MDRRDEVAIAWRLFQLNWIPLALMSAALALAVAFTRFSIEPVGLAVSLGFVAIYAGFGYANAHSPVRRDPRAYLDQVRDLAPVRDGTLRHLELFGLAGIVTFPSFHAASAVLYAWALWPLWWMRPIAIIANGAMLASTPIDGGHYFIDLAAGIGVAVLAIAAARRVSERVARQDTALAEPLRGAAAATPAE